MEWLTSLDWFALSCWFGAIVLIVLGFAGTIVAAPPGSSERQYLRLQRM